MNRSSTAVLLVTMLAPGLANAQQYAREVGDTLRYSESTSVDVQVDTPQGPLPVNVAMESDLALTFTHVDTLRGWYTALDVSSESPMGNQNPSTDELLGKPFVLLFSPRGEASRVSAPMSPPALRSITDVRQQFDDFFLQLPEDDLEIGYTWNYEAAVDDSVEGEGRNAFTKSGILTVVGDTVVAGRAGLKITGDLRATLSNTTFVKAQGITVRNEYSGVEHNLFVFAPEEGMLVYRRRNAELGGTSSYEGGPMPMSMTQEVQYESELRLKE